MPSRDGGGSPERGSKLGHSTPADFGDHEAHPTATNERWSDRPALDTIPSRVDRCREVIERLRIIAQGSVTDVERERLVREIISEEKQRLLEIYFADFGTDLGEGELQTRGYRIERFEATASPEQVMDRARQFHGTGADVIFVDIHTLAIKMPLAPEALDALGDQGWKIIDVGLGNSPFGLRIELRRHERRGNRAEFDTRGRFAVFVPPTARRPRRKRS